MIVLDLRKYVKKRVDTRRILNYEYQYCSHSNMEYGRPYLTLTIEKNKGTASFPGYGILLILDTSGRIKEIMRLAMMYNGGSKIKKFPDSVENKAEKLLDEVIIPTTFVRASDLSILHDIHLKHIHLWNCY